MALPSDILVRIATRLGTVPGVGNIHQRVPLYHDEAAARVIQNFTVPTVVPALDYEGDLIVRAWFIFIEATRRRFLDIGSRRLRIDYEIIVQGFHGINDDASPSTELVFRDLAEAVMVALQVDLDLGGTVDTTDPPEQRIFGQGRLPGALCHTTQILVRATRYPLVTPL